MINALRLLAIAAVLLLVTGCASYGVIDNEMQDLAQSIGSYSIRNHSPSGVTGDTAVILALSGGGTRAAALAFGVGKN